jgi:hypothetical protein
MPGTECCQSAGRKTSNNTLPRLALRVVCWAVLPVPKLIQSSLASAAESATPLAPDAIATLSPERVTSLLDLWKFGAYGWTSPTNLLITAAWMKWLDPEQDVCKIWARNDSGPISGSYSIRSKDEEFTVPLIQRLGIAPGFCSPNSGMQGSRALEKSRDAERLDVRFMIRQKVRFDLPLFIRLMNEVNTCNPDESREVFRQLIGIGKYLKKVRESLRVTKIREDDTASDCVAALSALAASAGDPQLVTVLAAGVVKTMLGSSSSGKRIELRGCEVAMTSANLQSGALGDFEVWCESRCILAGEAKGASIRFGVGDLRRALERGQGRTNSYLLVTAAPQPWDDSPGNDQGCRELLAEASRNGLQIAALTIRDVLVMCLAIPGVSAEQIYKSVNEQIEIAPSLRFDALEQWRHIHIRRPK